MKINLTPAQVSAIEYARDLIEDQCSGADEKFIKRMYRTITSLHAISRKIAAQKTAEGTAQVTTAAATPETIEDIAKRHYHE